MRLGTTPGPFRVEAGKRTLEIRARGFVSTTRAVEIPGAGTARETVTLVPEHAKEAVPDLTAWLASRNATVRHSAAAALTKLTGSKVVAPEVAQSEAQRMLDFAHGQIGDALLVGFRAGVAGFVLVGELFPIRLPRRPATTMV